ncbi:MAG: hypothetical protein JW892_02490 [Anaerolineae bacterium]|nr:hypothetical protein [Anaerolineae bacterium]
MAVFDLKTALILLTLGMLAAVSLAVALVHWTLSRREKPTAVPPALGGVALDDIHLLVEGALGAAPFGLLVLEDSQVLQSNAEAQRLLRLPAFPATLPDVEWLPLLMEDCSLARAEALAQPGAIAGGRYRTVTFVSGQTVRWWVSPWGARDGVFVFDITPQQRVEQAGRALLNDLAHELRTPVATILTHLEVLGLTDVGEEVHQQSLALSKDEAQRMARLINDMLELGRLETAPEFALRPVELLPLVEEVVFQTLSQAQSKRMTLSLEASPPFPLVLGHADRLRQVFLNLLDNAFKYARAGDRVVISLTRTEGGIACAVCDTGPGIPSEHLPYVTRRFYRGVSEQVSGSGLGLALVTEILRRHNTQLELESRVSGATGTCARFLLSLAEGGTGR